MWGVVVVFIWHLKARTREVMNVWEVGQVLFAMDSP